MKKRLESLLVLAVISASVVACKSSSKVRASQGNPAAEQRLSAIKSSEGVEIREDQTRVLFYQFQPNSLNGKFRRAGYVHPLYSYKGTVITEDMPADHPHHHGIFWAWHQVLWKGKSAGDGWTSEHITFKPVKYDVRENGNTIAVEAGFNWTTTIDPAEEVALINERTRITVYESTPEYRIIDFDIHLAALTDDLKIGGSDDDKGYGGFSARFRLPENVKFFSPDSAVIPRVKAVPAGGWMNFTGAFEGVGASDIGVAIFCGAPLEADNQQPWILRSKESMQNAVYPGREPVRLTRQGTTFRYRLVVQKAVMSAARLQELYAAYLKSH